VGVPHPLSSPEAGASGGELAVVAALAPAELRLDPRHQWPQDRSGVGGATT